MHRLPNYDFELSRSCFCMSRGTLKVTVEANRVTEIKDKQTGAVLPLTDNAWVRTIDGYFELMEDAQRKSAKVTATWDEALGYPTQINIDWVPQALDDEESFTLQLNPLLPL